MDHQTVRRQEPKDHLLGSTFDRVTSEFDAAISSLLQAGFVGPALMLLYSAIDVLAWLAIDDGRADVTGALLAEKGYPFAADDLWGARCGLLHNLSPESRHSRQGKATRIFQAWGPRRPGDLRALLELGGDMGVVPVHADDLLDALRAAVRRYRQALNESRELRRRVEERSRKVFVQVP